jgi:hypothetical protein
MSKTPHPAKAAGCSKRQIEAFEQIGAGVTRPSGYSDKVFLALLEKGLIEVCGVKVLCKDRFGTVQVPEFQQPLPVHIQWCKWCSENVTEEELEEFGI